MQKGALTDGRSENMAGALTMCGTQQTSGSYQHAGSRNKTQQARAEIR